MNYKEIPPITPELWLSNLLGVLSQIADRDYQERRWLAPDEYAWENPNELINSCMDDCVFDGFIETYKATFSERQRATAFQLRDELNLYCKSTPQELETTDVLLDPRWEVVRQKAAMFVKAFREQWPPRSGSTDSI